MTEAVAVTHVDNDEVRVTEWRFAAGAATGEHRHGYDYVVVPLTAGLLKAIGAAGETLAELVPGQAYFRKAGVEHNVFNAGDTPFAFVEIELKDRAG